MAEPPSGQGLTSLRGRIERHPREIPPPPATTSGEESALAAIAASSPPPQRQSSRRPRPPLADSPTRPAAHGPEPQVQLTLRVRAELDERLVDVVHDLRRLIGRTTKVELIELMISELPDQDPKSLEDLARRLETFRQARPRR
jgi:hypothetical protein